MLLQEKKRPLDLAIEIGDLAVISILQSAVKFAGVEHALLHEPKP
jgi:hypothetical protein